MKISNASKYILGIFAAAGILAGCSSGSQSSLTPSSSLNSVHGVTPSYHGVLLTAARPGAPLARAFKGALVTPDTRHKKKFGYISNFYNSETLEFHYPKGAALSNDPSSDEPQGMCAGKSRGDFWITDSGSDTLQEYKANTTTELASLSVSAGEPAGCSVDKTTGNVAASILPAGDVVVFANGTGSGQEIGDGLIETYYLGYDGSGNLFADGFNSSFAVAVVEMPKGSSTFHPISLPNSIVFPGGMQWDGTYITVNDQSGFAIYGYSISGSTATLQRTVSYSGAGDCVQPWIFKGHFLCPDAADDNAKVYNYPAGGSPVETWTGSFDLPIGAMVIEK